MVAINLLNTDNAADRRVYEILSRKFVLFDGVFGASDVALGVLESGTSFEKTILSIYQQCNTDSDFNKAFDKLNRDLNGKLNKQVTQLRTLLLTESPESKGEALEETKRQIEQYLYDVEYWSQFAEPEMDGSQTYYWQIDNWGEANFGSHGTLFIGAFCNNNRMLFPVLLLCDENGEYIDFEESEIVRALELANDDDVRFFKPTKEEMNRFGQIYDRLVSEMLSKYNASVESITAYNTAKIQNWIRIQTEQLTMQIAELSKEIEDMFARESLARNALEKADIFKEIGKKRSQLEKLKKSLPGKLHTIKRDAEKEILAFNDSYRVAPLLLVNIVLKF